MLVYVALTLVVLRLHPMTAGLDPSWAVGLNIFRNAGFLHGRDIAFTYGPLAFLAVPMDAGSNLIEGALFQFAVWVAFVAVLARLVYVRRIGLAPLAMFALLAFCGIESFHRFGYAGPDVFVAYLALLLLAGALEGPRWYGYYAGSVFVAALLALVKWSTGMHALSAVLAFPVAMALFDRRKALASAAIGFAGAPLVFTTAYLAYNPSFPGMWRYVRAGLELSAGHSAAQSTPYDSRDLTAALLCAALYLVTLACLYALRQPSFVLGFALLGPLFVEFKHAFIRYSGHVDIYFCYLPLAAGLVILFTRLHGRARWVLLMLIPLAAAVRYRHQDYATWYTFSHWPAGVRRAGAFGQLFRFGETRARLAALSAAGLAPDHLPPALMERIGNATVTAFPWECSYAAANPIHFVPMPIFSGFMAYTPFLDHWNATFFQDPSRAPRFVIFEWQPIDDRNPLLDGPETFTALFQNYDFDSRFGGRVLLKRRASPRFSAPRLVRTTTVRLGQPVRFEQSGPHPLVARIGIDYNLRGRALRFLFQIPEMRAIYASANGVSSPVRISTEVAGDGVPLNFLPSSLEETVTLFRDERMSEPMDSLAIAGLGSANFNDSVRVDLYEFAGFNLGEPLAAPSPPPDLGGLAPAGSQSSRIETLGGRGITEFGESEVIEIPSAYGYIEADGWATDDIHGAPVQSAWIKLDGVLHPAASGIPRRDIALLLRSAAYSNCGFRWTYPAWTLGSSTHSISLVTIGSDGRSYFEATPRRFRLTPAN